MTENALKLSIFILLQEFLHITLLVQISFIKSLVLSDLHPKYSGHKETDHLRLVQLIEIVMEFAIDNLAHSGNLVVKV